MSDWALLNAHRCTKKQNPAFGSDPSAGFNGLFQVKINGLLLTLIASDGRGWQHVSAHVVGSMIPPSWSMMCQVKDLFWEPEDWVIQFHPAESEYVNNHPGVLHLWKPIGVPFPTPDRLLVGFMNEEDIERINSDPDSPIKIIEIQKP